ncbi:hypothetical protein [Scandinavium goeteborgense]|jgi:hypothetical protein|uniref:Uncharacterized protein n=1 Tax=Scandinavium goeteborgense TaxID=1851514 RepID=A0A4R6EEA4_SCAGO|nr:hypothetical protein [Scandinavium goeteborgense]MCS2154293.1 hypothetical protein [Scandinavium goeteborgense]QKN81827.1 hypothetical protein A8O29_011240 [Scandinavium goeteborgense]TDN56566.1 hypothetical protein EC847_11071 [Scandinavium goeteborgense]
MSIDRMAKMVLRRQGIGVKDKVIRFRGDTIIFRLSQDGYDIYINGLKINSVKTQDVNEAVHIYKTTLSGAC